MGATNLFTYPNDEGAIAELGWVVVHPKHRGHGLAYRLGREGIRYAAGQNHRHVFLETEDFRLPAIKTYLKLGFVPEMREPDHPARWNVVGDLLAPIWSPSTPLNPFPKSNKTALRFTTEATERSVALETPEGWRRLRIREW